MNHSSISAREDSRAEDRISVRGKSEPSGGGKGEQPYADRNIINLVNNLSRLEEAAVCLSMNHSSISAREDFSGGGKEWANRLMSIDASISGTIIHFGQNAQSHVYPLIVYPSQSERISRAGGIISGRGQSERSGGGKYEQPYVD